MSFLNLDILGVIETHLKNEDSLKIDGYTWFGNNRKQLHINARCGSGGVGILIKNSLLMEYTCDVIDSTQDGILWVILKHNLDGSCLVLCTCYLPPENSSRQKDVLAFYDSLLTGIYEFQNMGPICMFGDFNSRCGNLIDFIEGVDELIEREVIDFPVNKYGHILIDFLINSNFCILNGRNSTKNDFTSVSSKGSSVVDYCLVSHSDLPMFSDFHVYTASESVNLDGNICTVVPSTIPDHSCITWKINIRSCCPSDNEQHVDSEAFVKVNVKDVPENFGADDRFINEIHDCVSQLEQGFREQLDIDNAYTEMCAVIKAEMVDKLPKKIYIQNSATSNKRRRLAKPWWNESLNNLWNDTCIAEKKWLKCKQSRDKTHLRSDYVAKRKLFDKHVQRSKRKYWYELQTDLVKASEADPNTFGKQLVKWVLHIRKRNIYLWKLSTRRVKLAQISSPS